MVGHVFGPIGADVVAEGHARGNDEMIRSEVHRAQVEKRVDIRCLLDLGLNHPEFPGAGGPADQEIPAVEGKLDGHRDEQPANPAASLSTPTKIFAAPAMSTVRRVD